MAEETNKKPEVKLYDTFSEFVENVKTVISQDINNAKNSLKKNWFIPVKDKDTSCLDVEKIPDKFERDELQDAYIRYLSEVRAPIEAFAIKYQNGIIAACEQSYRIQHASLPRAIAQGYLNGICWSNGAIPLLLINRIKVISDLTDKNYKDRTAD